MIRQRACRKGSEYRSPVSQQERIRRREPRADRRRNILACHSARASRAWPGEREPESSNQTGLRIQAAVSHKG